MGDITLSNVKISALVCTLPSTKTAVEDYIDYFGEKKIKKFVRTTGVKERYISNGNQTASDLCYVAAEEIFSKTNIKREDIDLVIFITQTPDYKTPSTAFVLHKRLGLSKKCTCFDMNIGCTAFLHGIYVAGSMLQAGTVSKALVMMGDSKTVHSVTEDTAETMMFGDAGAAMVLERGEGNMPMTMCSDGNGFSLIMNACGERFQTQEDKPNVSTYRFYMDGGAVFNFAVETVPKAISEFCKRNHTIVEDYDYLVMHQANLFIMKHIANEVDINPDKVAISIDRYGNTNGASIPVTIVDLVETTTELPDNMRLLIAGFGIGLSWGIMELNISKDSILPFVYTDDYYKEGKDIEYLKEDVDNDK